ncbi:CopL family metal-binding regulatory protein [Lysobacter olei]
MPVWSLLLRLLVAVALVFNGAAPAVAAVHAGHMVAPPVAAPAAELSCHEHHQAGYADQPPATGEHPGTSDCCESGACRCACVHSTPVAIMDPGVVASVIEHAESVRPMAPGHADAESPHLIRPPIG